MRARRMPERDETGAVALLAALLAGVLFVICALVIDLGLARDTRRDSQNASDASALAAANALYPDDSTCTTGAAAPPCFDDAVAAAKSYAAVNFDVEPADWSACADPNQFWTPAGETACISFTDEALGGGEPSQPSKVRVLMPLRGVPVNFAAAADVERIDIASNARASVDAGALITCGLCVLGSGSHSIGNGDTSVLSISGAAGIHINGSLAGNPNSEVTVQGGSITIEGSFGASDFDPPPTQGPRIGDPMADVVFPDYPAVTPRNNSNPCTGGPGVYASYEVGNNATCTLVSGLYVFTGTLSLRNTSRLLGVGVSMVFTCGSQAAPRACGAGGEAGGIFDAKNGEVKVTRGAAPMPEVVVAYDRTNTSPMTLQGNGDSVLTGDVYARDALLYANGTSCHTVTSGAVVVDDIYMNGNNSCLNLSNSDAAVYELPPDGLHLDQ